MDSTNTANVTTENDNFVLTDDNYYSPEANKRYMSNSLFKALYGHPAHPDACQAAALLGPKPESEALLVGSYVDAYFEGADSFENWKIEHKDQITMKSGKSYYKFITDADESIKRVSKDDLFMHFMDGDHQAIMTGEIAGQPFKIKMDAYHPGEMIVDLKYVKNAASEYSPILGRPLTFIESYGYFIQGAIYQEIVRQNTGKKLPFYIAFITKESETDFDIVELPQDKLDDALDYVKSNLIAMPYAFIKKNPKACGKRTCAYCKSLKTLIKPKTYAEFEAYSQDK